MKNWKVSETFFKYLTFLAAVFLPIAVVALFVQLYNESLLALKTFGLKFVITDEWDPASFLFGGVSPIYGTLVTSFIAIVLAVPLAIGIAFFLVEIAPPRIKFVVRTVVELLAGIPSIVYGMWGLFIFAPVVAEYIGPFLQQSINGFLEQFGLSAAEHFPFFSGPINGLGLFTAGFILAIMILPIIAMMTCSLLEVVPAVVKEACIGAGATRWEYMWNVAIPYIKKELTGACLLGLGRALGETMAVTFVIGNAYKTPLSFFQQGTSIASSLANEFVEAVDIPIHRSSLILLGFILLVIAIFVQTLAYLITRKRVQS